MLYEFVGDHPIWSFLALLVLVTTIWDINMSWVNYFMRKIK